MSVVFDAHAKTLCVVFYVCFILNLHTANDCDTDVSLIVFAYFILWEKMYEQEIAWGAFLTTVI